MKLPSYGERADDQKIQDTEWDRGLVRCCVNNHITIGLYVLLEVDHHPPISSPPPRTLVIVFTVVCFRCSFLLRPPHTHNMRSGLTIYSGRDISHVSFKHPLRILVLWFARPRSCTRYAADSAEPPLQNRHPTLWKTSDLPIILVRVARGEISGLEGTTSLSASLLSPTSARSQLWTP